MDVVSERVRAGKNGLSPINVSRAFWSTRSHQGSARIILQSHTSFLVSRSRGLNFSMTTHLADSCPGPMLSRMPVQPSLLASTRPVDGQTRSPVASSSPFLTSQSDIRPDQARGAPAGAARLALRGGGTHPPTPLRPPLRRLHRQQEPPTRAPLPNWWPPSE